MHLLHRAVTLHPHPCLPSPSKVPQKGCSASVNCQDLLIVLSQAAANSEQMKKPKTIY